MNAGFRLSPQQIRAFEVTDGCTEDLITEAIIEVSGGVDVQRFAAAVSSVCAQMEVLRTELEQRESMKHPVQVVNAVCRRSLAVNKTVNETGVGTQAQQDMLYFPGTLIADESGGYIWKFRISSLLLDAQSIPLLVRQVGDAYAGRLEAEEVLQYPDIAEWEHDLIDGQEAAEGIEYWHSATKHESTRLRWISAGNVANARPATRKARTLSNSVLENVRHFCKENAVSMQAFCLSVWGIVLARHNGQSSIDVMVEADGRSYEELKSAIGLLARELPITVDVSGSDLFVDKCRQTETQLEAATDLQEYLAGKSAAVIRDAGFAYRDLRIENDNAETGMSVVSLRSCLGPGVIRAAIDDHAQAVNVSVDFDAGRLSPAAAQIWLDQYLDAIAATVESPQSTIETLSLLPPNHHESLLCVYGQGDELALPEQSIVCNFVEQAQTNPDKAAVHTSDESCTYEQIDSYANRLANYLQSQGVQANDRIALFLERSPRMIATILGVLKSGACYVPIDPSYPAERVAFMIADCGAHILLTDQIISNAIVPSTVKTISLVDSADSIDTCSGVEPDKLPGLDSIAYMIYTSGSTGKPKGVCVSHRNLAASTLAREAYYSDRPGRYLLLSSFAFDSSVAGIFWTLSTGGTLVLPDQGDERDPYKLTALIRQTEVNTLLGLPSLYQLLLDEGKQQSITSLRTVIVAGEACSSNLVKRHQTEMPGCRLYNEYGPTEATVWSTAWEAPDGPVPERVPIGRPIPGACTYILDRNRCPSPWGSIGELYVGGPGVSCGYHGEPELTAKRFYDNPFGDGQIYATGDLACISPDGELEFFGRNDDQVKLRGYRIELGEIDQALLSFSDVSEAVVVARKKDAVFDSLAAYILAETHVDTTLLTEFLASTLPAHMVPSRVIQLDEFPRTPNGKIDKDRLPLPEDSRSQLAAEYAQPRNALEAVLSELWSELLDVEIVGIHDNIFEMGGTSLLVAQMAARIREYFDFNVRLRSLFDCPTVERLADHMMNDIEHGERLVEIAKLLIDIVDDTTGLVSERA